MTGSSAYMQDLSDRAPQHRGKIMGFQQATIGSVWIIGPAIGVPSPSPVPGAQRSKKALGRPASTCLVPQAACPRVQRTTGYFHCDQPWLNFSHVPILSIVELLPPPSVHHARAVIEAPWLATSGHGASITTDTVGRRRARRVVRLPELLHHRWDRIGAVLSGLPAAAGDTAVAGDADQAAAREAW
jgi:hypothetical protein